MTKQLILTALLSVAPTGADASICPVTGAPVVGEPELVEIGDGVVICSQDQPLTGIRARFVSGPQAEPVQSEECLPRWRLPYPYPDAAVTTDQRSTLRASGPWQLEAPPSSLSPEYATAEDLRTALWPLPDSFEAPAWAYRSPSVPVTGRTSSGWWAIGETLRPAPPGGRSWLDLGTGEYGAQVRGAFIEFYGAAPTIGQAVLLDAHHITGDRWWPDKLIYNAQSCEAFAASPPVFPTRPASWAEEEWLVARKRHLELGLTMRDGDGDPVTEAGIICHFRPDATGCTNTEPEPPPLPGCAPYEGSRCERLCEAKGKNKEACFALADRFPKSVLSRACSGVCRGEEPTEPPEAQCLRWEPASAEVRRVNFVPGVPSTGVLEVEVLMSGEWVEVPCQEVLDQKGAS